MPPPTKQELLEHNVALMACTQTMEELAVNEGVSVTTIRGRIRRGEIELVVVGKLRRVWRNDVPA